MLEFWVRQGFYSLAALTIGAALDFWLGDPVYWFHPVRLMGRLISKTEEFLRREGDSERAAFLKGLFLVVWVTGISVFVPGCLLFFAYRLHLAAGIILEAVFCYQLLAAKSLKTESMRVYEALKQGVAAGRKAVGMIVGRDTDSLSEEGIIKACVETIAENTSDGVTAPFFYMAFGGALWGFFYKAVNTMDSMVGYRNEKYLYFGRAAARLDDVLNYIPARLSAFFMLLAVPAVKGKRREALYIYKRDSRNHKSPNSAQTEAVMAGALGVRLAGNACYFGQLYEKPYIGDSKRPIEREDIKRANVLLYGAALIGGGMLLTAKLLLLLPAALG